MMRRLWYLPLEPVTGRYTAQLCDEWMPAAIVEAGGDLRVVRPGPTATEQAIRVGRVLDATGRGRYALAQVSAFLAHLDAGDVRDGDVVYLQDFWTPGWEAIPYAAEQMGLRLRYYAMVHAQSVDEYDFTYPMRRWMRPLELGADALMTGLFVASTVHKQLLRQAGFTAPIHVVGLPISAEAVRRDMDAAPPVTTYHPQRVIFTSRWDREKQPQFMLAVAARYLQREPRGEWVCTTSLPTWRGDVVALRDAHAMAEREPRFRLLAGLSKAEYYAWLKASAVQFNCALQDFVSWTLLEAVAAGCDVVYPDWRSFPECVPPTRRYAAWNVDAAVRLVMRAVASRHAHPAILAAADHGRRVVASILCGAPDYPEASVWYGHETEGA